MKNIYPFYVNNFNPKRKKQIGQKELLNTSDYNQLKEDYPDSNLNKLKYKKQLRTKIPEIVEEEFLPLRND